MKDTVVIICISVASILVGCQQPSTDQKNSQFKKHILTEKFVSEGVAVADVNNDGKKDVLAGPFWFEAPEWITHQIDTPEFFDPDTQYSNSFLDFSQDVNQDGWIDLIVVDFPGTAVVWYENPKSVDRLWNKHHIYEPVGNESPAFVDIDGDGRKDLLFADNNVEQMMWMRSPSNPGDTTWNKFTISEKGMPGTMKFSHGLGFFDINQDGRKDVVIKDGWWEGPENPMDPDWIFHEVTISENCSQMYPLDVNEDGLTDVVSASAHLSGIWWQEQKKDDENKMVFEQHVISYAFAESHALELGDINGDGALDIVTGKRSLKRNTWKKNPGTHGPPLLYWFEFTPGKEPFWVAHQIDDKSGAGLNIVVEDITEDGRADIVVACFKGVFVFENNIAVK